MWELEQKTPVGRLGMPGGRPAPHSARSQLPVLHLLHNHPVTPVIAGRGSTNLPKLEGAWLQRRGQGGCPLPRPLWRPDPHDRALDHPASAPSPTTHRAPALRCLPARRAPQPSSPGRAATHQQAPLRPRAAGRPAKGDLRPADRPPLGPGPLPACGDSPSTWGPT